MEPQGLPLPPVFRDFLRQHIKKGLAAGYVFRLLKGHEVYLSALNGGGERFVELFSETYRRIPLGPRRSIVKHWRSDPFPLPLVKPEITLSVSWNGREGGRGLRGDMAVTKCRGHILHFFSKLVAALPDDLARDLIAHELAHVYQWSIGRNLEVMNPFECEEEADWMMEGWGFDATAIDDWMLANGHVKVLDPETMSKAALRRHDRKVNRAGRY